MRVLSWNIQWGRGCDGRVDLARMASVLAAAGWPEVICLQEVAVNFPGLAGGSGEDEVAWITAALPDYTPIYAPATDVPHAAGGRSQFGNMVLSRLPVLQVWRHLLPWPADPALPSMQRVCLEAVVQACDGPLRVMTTHLEYYSAMQRLAQAEALRGLHAEACAQGRAQRIRQSGGASDSTFAVLPRPARAVLCGDFNCKPDGAALVRLLAPYDDATPAWQDAWCLAHAGQPHAPTVGLHGCEWPDHAYCCDFMLVTADLAGAVAGLDVLSDTAASDHQPVLLSLRLPAGA
ncbi:MAG: endonuclease/exonuclease/phosphatase family protein [Rhodocyclaceae bacterium]|nr:endonuclease/exonuclease/phosphatase family protein [Rhodocyclaceae bacterium]